MARSTKGPEFRRWVEQVAGQIGDPVRRLRFLRAVAPAGDLHGARCRSRLRLVLILMLAAASLFALTFFTTRSLAGTPRLAPVPRPHPAAGTKTGATPDVWRVETTATSELYSNGLRIDTGYAVANRPRSYLAFPLDDGAPQRQTRPVGIVFHSTESLQVPFEAGHNEALKRIGESLLDYISRRRSYHFLIDRFGRVYRVVAEGDAANHAGHSVWADDRWMYLNLNDSFLGIAFESQTNEEAARATTAQVRSAAMLTEMLRVRYAIAAGACVTHAQVSVNPSNMRIGYHVDWGSQFPFEAVGLPDNYALALPAIWACGFEWDESYWNAASERLREGIGAAAEIFERQARAAGVPPETYRKRLRKQYRERLAARPVEAGEH